MHQSPSEANLRGLTVGELHDRIEQDINWFMALWCFMCEICNISRCVK